jgi:Asp-tRNA(Asn)/Glu-tRNA(Gln) amidotransferase A subunit family amidase
VAVSDLWRLDATAQAALVREKSIRPIALVDTAIARIENLNAGVRFIGVQFARRFGDEATLFRLAAQLEQARPWAGRWPILAGGS